MRKEESTTIEDPRSFVISAITRELMENPYCSMASLMSELVDKYDQGDSEALELAIEMAKETFSPKQKIIDRIKSFFG